MRRSRCRLCKLKCFLDPFRVIKVYPSCLLNSLASLSLGTVVWAHVTNIDLLDDAHNSLVDAKAQTDIIFHLSFITFLDRGKSIVEMSKVFNKNQL